MIEEFLKALFGDNTGIVMLMTKINEVPRHRPFNYPEDIPRLVKNIQDMDALGANVYINMSMFERLQKYEDKWSVKAKKEYSRGCPAMWLDADRCHPSYLSVRPSIVLRTSPGNYQAFWPMIEELKPDVAEDIARRLAYSHADKGADTGGWQCNKFMRVPGTHNYKPERTLPSGDAPEVEVVSLLSERFDPSIFDGLPAVEVMQAQQHQAAQEAVREYQGDKYHYTEDYPDLPALAGTLTYPQDVIALWNVKNLGDRSRWCNDIVKNLYQLNLSDDDIREGMVGHPIYRDKCRDKWGGHPDKIREDVDRILEHLREAGVMPRLNISKTMAKPKPSRFETWQIDSLAGKETTLNAGSKFMSGEEIKNLPQIPWLIDGFLPQHSHINFFGPSGIGKSFQVLDWALRIAGGYPWYPYGEQGPPVQVTHGPVVYVVAEGLEMMGERVNAWEVKFNKPCPDREHILFYGDSVQLFDTASVSKFYGEIINNLSDPPVLIIFDTLSQCMIGVNENSPEVMSSINGLMNNLRIHLGCSTLVVHHTGYDGDHERGHSSFPASAATRIKIDEQMGQLIIECEKQRGGKEFPTVYVEKFEVLYQHDNSSMSLVMIPTAEPRKQLEWHLLNSRHLRILGALASHSDQAMASNDLKARSGLHDMPFLRFKSELEQSGYLTIADKQIILTREGKEAYERVKAKDKPKTNRLDVSYTPVSVTQTKLEERPDEPPF